MKNLKALIFDCDGVIAETERDGHRVSFNRAFREAGLKAEWSVEEYGELVKIAGGKERMKHYFKQNPEILAPENCTDEFIKKLHKRKTEIFMEMSERGELPVRPGIRRLVTQAHEKGILLAVCSTSNEKSVTALIKSVLGEESLNWFDRIFAGDIVKAKKPAPDIYNLVKDNFNLNPDECMVVEDSRNGLLAAKAAGMHCIVTVSYYSTEEDFAEADIVVSSLGDPGEPVMILRQNPAVGKDTALIDIDTLEKMIL